MNEKKCSNCGEWTPWEGKIEDKCVHCNTLLVPHLYQEDLDKKAALAQVEIDWWVVQPEDGLGMRMLKVIVNAFRLLFLGIASFVLWVIAWLAG
jgi:hypothetical protein